MEHGNELWYALAVVIYLLGWFVSVKVMRLLTPSNEKEWEEYTERHGIPYINISDMITGIGALWFVWIILGILWLIYWLVSKLVDMIVSLFR